MNAIATPNPAGATAWARGTGAKCRFCATPLQHSFVDLGMSPLCQTHIEPHQLNHMEPFYPLHAWVCHACFLVQLEQYVAPSDIFSDYAYFSSYSDSWVEHARRYAAHMTGLLQLGPRSKVMEIASNDGYPCHRATTGTLELRRSAISCSTSCARACRASASSRQRTWRRRRSPRASPRQ